MSETIEKISAERDRLREAIIEACDLLMERTKGNGARSPAHNARLCLEQAIGHFNGRPISPEESK